MLNEKVFTKADNAKMWWSGQGSFGEICGEIQRGNGYAENCGEQYKVVSTYRKNNYGVFTRNDAFENTSAQTLIVNNLKSRFIFDGGEYEVYTQFNNWLSESVGEWQPLNTSVVAKGRSVRTSQLATPFMALWNKQTQRGAVFHLIPNGSWEIDAIRFIPKTGKFNRVMVEMGFTDNNLALKVEPGETVQLPEIICYEFRNKLDMDCFKLHDYMNTEYPLHKLPMIYNSWLYNFPIISYEMLKKQIAPAAEMGLEYFVIDAGWFGKSEKWFEEVGDWEENKTAALCGRMIDIANEVREKGMKFGIWLEPERAGVSADILKNHRDFFFESLGQYFFDFANQVAREALLAKIFGLIDHYGVEFIKFDFNADCYTDPTQGAFVEYHKGQKAFIKAIRDRYPNIYLSSCASGGGRMNLSSNIDFDSYWPSDDESPYEEMRIYKDSILRISPQIFEKWAVVRSFCDFEPQCEGREKEKLIACGDSAWYDVDGVHMSFLQGYLTGGPIGFSCDLTALSEKVRSEAKAFISKMKENRSFWQRAVCRILCDTPSVTVYQYSDMELSKIEVRVFVHRAFQNEMCVYPVVDEGKNYYLNGELFSGKVLAEEGFSIALPEWYEVVEVSLEEAKENEMEKKE